MLAWGGWKDLLEGEV